MDWHTPSSDVPLFKEWAQEERAIRLYEEPGCFGLSVASSEEFIDRTPEKWEREIDRMEAEPTRAYDDEGRIW